MPATDPSALGTEKRFSEGDPNLHSIDPPSNNLPLSLDTGRSNVHLTLVQPLPAAHFYMCNLRAAFHSISLCDYKH